MFYRIITIPMVAALEADRNESDYYFATAAVSQPAKGKVAIGMWALDREHVDVADSILTGLVHVDSKNQQCGNRIVCAAA